MKRTILFVLMAIIIAKPCLAQKVEPDGIFKIDGTLWLEVSLAAFGGGYQNLYGFYQEDVYAIEMRDSLVFGCSLLENFSYVDLLVVSFFNKSFSEGLGVHGIMQPLGIGMVLYISETESNTIELDSFVLIKKDNNWTPPSDCEPVDW